ncbi:MAG: DUF1659 domain-containing protein [Firmicutes bacterium]|nr:DUF1659 domain-containing protein [Bacillota bacterium]
MAVIAIPSGDRLQLRVQVGINPQNGNPVYSTRSWSRVKPGASDEHLYEFAAKLGELGADALESISRVKTVTLVDDGN